jgi:hypothetical protein
MCRISVTCCCHARTTGGGSGLAVFAVGVLALVAAAPVIVAAVHAAVDLLTAVIIGVVVAVGVVVAGWIVKAIAVAVIEEWSLRRHNERMAQLHPHLRDHLPPRRHARAVRVGTPAVGPRPLAAPPRRPAVPASPVALVGIYPTPRAELAARRERGVV